MTENELQLLGFIRNDRYLQIDLMDNYHYVYKMGEGLILFSCGALRAKENGEWYVSIGSTEEFKFYDFEELQALMNLLDKRRVYLRL